MRHAPIAPLAALMAVLCTGVGCEESPLIKDRCENDEACGPGFVCRSGECVAVDTLSCTEVDGGQAVLQPTPLSIEFGFTGSGTSERELNLRNIGDCTVTVFEARFASGEASRFDCPACSDDRFPLEIFPGRREVLTIFFTPDDEVGAFADALLVLSDDPDFPELRLPVRATFDGAPAVAAIPSAIDFDFVAVGRTAARTLEIRNGGTGVAPLEILRIDLETATTSAFSFDVNPAPTAMAPVRLAPVEAGADQALAVDVRYHPREVARHRGALVLYSNQPNPAVVKVPLTGSSETPAKIVVSPERINFDPVPLGQTAARPLTLVNEGGTPLRVQHRWGGAGLTTDLSTLPAVVPAVESGRFTEMQVLFTATAPTPVQSLLILETNDPSRPTVTVPVSAEGQPVAGAQVLKIDMTFTNGSNGALDDDFRNVDLALESPFGLVVDKNDPQPADWTPFGNPTWLAFGPKEEPERIVLTDAMADGTYRVLLTYQEDCASVPTGIVAAVLGISVEALVVYLTGGSSLGITAGQVSSVIERLCLARDPSAVTLTIFVNGAVIREVPATLGRKGDFLYAAEIVRTAGRFEVRP